MDSASFQASIALCASLLLGCIWYVTGQPIFMAGLILLPFAVILLMPMTYFSCLGFILFSYFRIHEAFPVLMPFRIPQLFALATIAGFSLHLWLNKEEVIELKKESKLLLFFALWVYICGVFATNRPESFAMLNGVYIKVILMSFMVSMLVKTHKEFVILTWGILISSSAIAIVALKNKAMGIGLVEGTRVTISRDIGSVLGDPNDLSLVLTFPISFAFSVFFAKSLPTWQRVIGFLVVCLLGSAIIATQSRGGLLGFVAVLGVYVYARVRNKALLIVGGGLALMILMAAAGISGRQSGGAQEEGIDESAMGRIYAWGAAVGMAVADPLTGVGPQNFVPNYYFYSSHWDGKNHAVHSTWFQVLAETGFIGMGLFLAFVGMLVKLSMRLVLYHRQNDTHLAPYAEAILGGVVGFCVSGTFLTQGFSWPLYILFGLTIAMDNMTFKRPLLNRKS
ncbi:O-antigen ligase family protein [Vibrio sp. Of7-15]|uniref:O-antigen ligase family protein n=1 Tax=Vibrio sp. Of7-15 TaxID=2724879 RepID=UPI001EF34C75|nr:O-antigen ligase family protein [Vibrio sp. Of7-15]MCG7496243.1 O-antigen ligase family protein [Vibrio sp. Of7-15]